MESPVRSSGLAAACALCALLAGGRATANAPPRPPGSSWQQGQEQGKDKDQGKDKEHEQHAANLRAIVVLKMAPYFEAGEGAEDGKRAFVIAVAGDDPTSRAMLRLLPGKKVGTRPVVVVQVAPEALAERTGPRRHDLVYLATSVDDEFVARIVTSHGELATPLVAERDGFAAGGGGVQLFVELNTLRFEVNAAKLRRQGVKVSAQLLKLSKRGPTR